MKKLLLSLFTISSFIGYSQADCASAIGITVNGTISAPAPSGTLEPLCFTETSADQTNAPFAGLWYTYSPAANGVVVINSNLAANVAPNSNDTRVSVFSGSCAALACVASNDDISGSNYLSTVSFNAIVGNTYYIYWDNFWNENGFDFDFTFTPVSCFPVNVVNAPTAVTTNSATLNWDASATTPIIEYQIEYGPAGFTQGSGTMVTSPTNSVSISSLTVGAVYDYYIRTHCTAPDYSAWTTVNTLALVKVLPYASGLDNSVQLAGWTIFGGANQGLGNNAAAAQSPAGYWIFNTAAAPGPNNNWLFAPAMSLQAGEQVTVSFYHRASTTARTLRVTVGNNNTVAAQTTQLLSTPIAVGASWTQVTVPVFTAPSAGTYYFGFNDNSTATPATATSMRLDTFNFTSVLASDSFTLSGVRMYPNPAKDVLNIQSETEVLTKVSIADLNGRVVREVTNNVSQISLGNLAKGIYMVTIESANAKKVEKLIVE